jgi:CRP/FNR family transcriptional regulator, cyclic AMP receptor protein
MAGTRGAGGNQAFLDRLTPEQLQALRAIGIQRAYPRGAALFHERQGSDRVILILSGRVKLSSLSDDGKEALLGIRGPGDLIGEMSALDGEPRSATATALEPVDALAVPPERFEQFLRQNPDVSLLIIRLLSQRLRDADRKRLEFAAQDTMGRVAARLIELADRFGVETADGLRIDLPISQEELAAWTGCSREAVTKALHSMRELEWLETQRRAVVLHDLEAVRRRAA